MSIIRLFPLFFGVLLLPFVASPTVAGEFPYAKVDYSADLVMESRTGPNAAPEAMTMKVYFSKGKQRSEILQGGLRTVVIMDLKDESSVVLMEKQKTYMMVPSEQNSPTHMMHQEDLKMTKIGTETVNGVKAIKYKVENRDEDGGHFSGHYWLTADNVPVRMEGEDVNMGERSQIKVDYKNIKIGKQDPSLFTIPPGYTAMSMPTMPPMPMAPGQLMPPGEAMPDFSKEAADKMKKELEEMMKQMQKR